MINTIKSKFNKLFFNYFIKNSKISKKFEYIYKKKLWGENSNCIYYSGDGSHNINFTKNYVSKINSFIKKNPGIVVDLGCGDFNIGSKISVYTKKYYGIDIFPDLIKYNKKKYSNKKKISFLCLNIVNSYLPNGNICILRQVLQHLDNKSIKILISKIKLKYKYLIVTEHTPKFNLRTNKDIIAGYDIRLNYNSSVILDQPPFNLKYKKKIIIDDAHDPLYIGLIQTIIYYL